MNYLVSFLLSALQAAAVALTTWLTVFATLLITWLAESDGSVELNSLMQASIFVWLLAHGVPLAVSSGSLAGLEFDPFVITAAPLGYSVLIFLLLGILGHRLSSLPTLWPAWIGGGLSYSGLAFTGFLVSLNTSVSAADWQALFFPLFWFLTLVVGASLIAPRFELIRDRSGVEARERLLIHTWFSKSLSGLHWSIRSVIMPSLRGGVIALFLLILVASSWLVSLMILNWIEVIRLYESLQLSLLGVVVVTLGQLFILPNLLVWSMAWLSGPGFAIGAGSSFSILGSQAGPLPALPIFAALPTETWDRAVFLVSIPVLCGFVATLLIRKYCRELRWEYATRLSASAALAFGLATVTSLFAYILTQLSSGSLGPGRLDLVGANPIWTALAVWLEVFIGSLLAGMLVLSPVAETSRSRR